MRPVQSCSGVRVGMGVEVDDIEVEEGGFTGRVVDADIVVGMVDDFGGGRLGA